MRAWSANLLCESSLFGTVAATACPIMPTPYPCHCHLCPSAHSAHSAHGQHSGGSSAAQLIIYTRLRCPACALRKPPAAMYSLQA